jgi:23S rRNA G2069 N7-methylase RlmK/C1962 C5-methylase RlmI
MWYSKQLRQVRRARKVARTQQHQLLALELEGIVAITLHSAIQAVTVPIERAAGAQVVDTLREVLRERRQVLKTEARQLRRDWQESETQQARKGQNRPAQPPASDHSA